MDPAQRLVAACEAIYGRYQREVVEAYQLCPFARAAREAGEVSVDVELMTALDLGRLAQLAQDRGNQTHVSIALIVLPRLNVGPISLRRATSALSGMLEASDAKEGSPWHLADFHPHGSLDLATPERAVNFLRRSPDPTLQLVRKDVLSAMRNTNGPRTRYLTAETLGAALLFEKGPAPSLTERIAQANWETSRQHLTEISDLLSDIQRERAERYHRTGLACPDWTSSEPGPCTAPAADPIPLA